MSSVTQDWVQELPWKMQSVMLTSTRGPDEARHPRVKIVNRWIREQLFHDADPANPFIASAFDFKINIFGKTTWEVTKAAQDFLSDLEHELEYLSVHYFGHFIHALEIIGYEHPDPVVAQAGRTLYREVCQRILHLPVESARVLRERLRDVTAHA